MRQTLRRLIVGVVMLAAQAAAAGTVALVPFGEVAQSLEPDLRLAVEGVSGVDLAAAAATADDVKAAQGLGLACGPESDECLVKLALFLRAERLIAVSAVRGASGIELQLGLVDAATGRRAGGVSARLETDQPRALLLRDAALELLAPERFFGSLVVRVKPADARVSVDGVERNSGEALQLRAAPHVVIVEREGFVRHQRTVDVRPGAQLPIEVTLAPVVVVTPEEPPGVPLFVIGATAAGIGAAAAVVGAAVALSLDAALLTPGSISGAQARIDALAAEKTAAVIAGVGLIVAVAGGVTILMADEPAASKQ